MILPMRLLLTLTGVCAALLITACAALLSQHQPPALHTPPPHNPACPDLAQWPAARLHGQWHIELPELGQRGQLTLRQHPEFAASLRGELQIDGHDAIASGDLDGGELNLDESRDGKSLHAFWTGQLSGADCGQTIEGQWESLPQDGQPSRRSRFILRRAASPHTINTPSAPRW